jgi:hypothetical protein
MVIVKALHKVLAYGIKVSISILYLQIQYE